MTDETMPADAAPMEGQGGYNRRSAVQASGASPALPLLEQAARAAALPADGAPIVIADYGASQGRNSLLPMAAAIAALRERAGAARAVSVVHTDLPGNDFSALFQLLATDPASYLRGDPAAFASAVGRSFYGQILPPASVTLGWSAWAVQWLSRTPALIPDHVQAACSRDEAARAAYARQAAKDWETFLTCRGRELHPGGRLVVLAMARTEEGDFGYRAILAAMYDSLRALVAEELVSAEEALRMAIPTVGRSRAELAAPFSAGGFAGLTLERLDLFNGEDSIWQDFLRDGDARPMARAGLHFRVPLSCRPWRAISRAVPLMGGRRNSWRAWRRAWRSVSLRRRSRRRSRSPPWCWRASDPAQAGRA